MNPWVLILFVGSTSGSFCGKSGVPFSVEVLPSGAPVLGCAQPSCLAQPADDVDDSVFNTDASGQIDGFFREGDNSHQGYLQTNKLRANCSDEFDQLACSRKNQWVGGIEYIDHPRQPLLLQCCTFEGLRFSQIVGVTPIGPGEAVTGGEVVRDGRQISFDVIANIRKVVNTEDPRIVSYEVAVRRMNCLPDPPEIEIPVEDDVEFELIQILENANNGSISLGHLGHAHTEQEKIWPQEFGSRKRQRKERRRIGHVQHLDRPGSFGAPIFHPTMDTKQRQHYSDKEDRSDQEVKPVMLQADTVTTTTTAPLFTFPTFPPYTFPTILPSPHLLLFDSHNSVSTPRMVNNASMSSHAFGITQPSHSALSSSTVNDQTHAFAPMSAFMQLPHLHQLPRPQLVSNDIGMQEQNGTMASPFHLFAAQQAHHVESQSADHPRMALPLYQPFEPTRTPVKHNDYASLLEQQILNPFSYSPNAQTTPTHAGRQKKDKSPIRGEERTDLIEPSLPPTQQQLGALFRPPPFPALTSALQNFQAQG
ncbi:unnamed protein product [Cylicocyclus nassatus]|uniref:Uncharacterized protein n=1 Tax=Cylicocyclus nassatus TaxID=53992 RepID=A0AA36HG70_CYLNA|nr:unnamed protein product [Cylicocyclus nassatus]